MAVLTRDEILAFGKPKGYLALAQTVRDLRAGRVTPATERLADVLERVFNGTLAPERIAAALDLKQTRGRPKGGESAKRAWDRISRIGEFIAKRVDKYGGPNKRGALEKALGDAADQFQRDRRSLQGDWKRYQQHHRVMATLGVPAFDVRALGDEHAARTSLAEFRRLEAQMKQWDAEVKAAFGLMRRHISREEIAGELGKQSLPAVLKIARARAAKAKKK